MISVKHEMMNFLKLVLAASIFLSAMSCNHAGKENTPEAHYSIALHLDSLKNKWSEKIQVVKQVQISGREEQQIIDKTEFVKDLEFFKKLDIARNSYLGRYHADTLMESGTTTITYSANSSSMEIKNQEFVLDEFGKLIRFFSDRQYNSVVSDYELKVEIRKDSVFVIDQIQDIPGKARQNLIIKYTILSGR